MTEREVQMVDLLSQMIATPSVTGNEEAVSDLLTKYLSSRGCAPQRFGLNVVALSDDFNSSRPTLMLSSHLDTVAPVAGWQRDAFSPVVEGERLYGLGSNDAGGSVVALTTTFLQMRGETLPVNLLLALTVEEERGGSGGMRALLPALDAAGIRVNMALVGEPTSLECAVAERGLVVLDCETRGIAGHAARNTGRNALYAALDDIDRLRRMTMPAPSPTLGPARLAVTQIEAGSRHNVIPDLCKWVVDIRTTDTCTNEMAIEAVRNQLGSDTTATPRSTRIRASAISPEHPLTKAVAKAGVKCVTSATTSDMSLLHNIPSVKMGPGHSHLSHTPDEYLPLPMLKEALQLYSTVIRNIQI